MAERRSRAEVQKAKDTVLADRATVIKRYNDPDPEPAVRLAADYKVNAKWLVQQLRDWGVQLRDASARTKRGCPPPLPRR
ncbi:hypothetical protein AB0G73_24255 [Streptomyces sp. NPDC020719]|uniref:hypothetical protein n=1 Tax=Streptomyces sp. NPDC020719 TaxID=3154896 RepID=UPI0033D846BD